MVVGFRGWWWCEKGSQIILNERFTTSKGFLIFYWVLACVRVSDCRALIGRTQMRSDWWEDHLHLVFITRYLL